MCDKYESFLQRITGYRKKINLTQVEASEELGINQSQLSKMELGKTIYSYKMLQSLYQKNWDIDYFITGRKYEQSDSEISHFIEKAKEKKELLKLAVWALEQGMQKSDAEFDKEIGFEIRLLKYRAYAAQEHPILYEIRVASGILQIPMSEKLGVNIKKYRMLERNEISPDAELLLRIYEETGCRPSLLLDPDNIDQMIVGDLWQFVGQKVKKEILLLMKQGVSVLNS